MKNNKSKSVSSHSFNISEDTLKKLSSGKYEICKIVGNEIEVKLKTNKKGK